MKRILLLALVLLVILGAVFLAVKRPRTEKITMAMTFVPNVQFAPWYVAEAKGFFRDEGIEVEFDYRMDIDALPLTAAGKIDFAIAGGDQVITARAQGIPVVYLACLYAKFPRPWLPWRKAGSAGRRTSKARRSGSPSTALASWR